MLIRVHRPSWVEVERTRQAGDLLAVRFYPGGPIIFAPHDRQRIRGLCADGKPVGRF